LVTALLAACSQALHWSADERAAAVKCILPPQDREKFPVVVVALLWHEEGTIWRIRIGGQVLLFPQGIEQIRPGAAQKMRVRRAPSCELLQKTLSAGPTPGHEIATER
jgi:hypothetical protein